MSQQKDCEEVARLERLNQELSASLGRCRSLLDECRSKLAANANEHEAVNDDEDSSRRERG